MRCVNTARVRIRRTARGPRRRRRPTRAGDSVRADSALGERRSQPRRRRRRWSPPRAPPRRRASAAASAAVIRSASSRIASTRSVSRRFSRSVSSQTRAAAYRSVSSTRRRVYHRVAPRAPPPRAPPPSAPPSRPAAFFARAFSRRRARVSNREVDRSRFRQRRLHAKCDRRRRGAGNAHGRPAEPPRELLRPARRTADAPSPPRPRWSFAGVTRVTRVARPGNRKMAPAPRRRARRTLPASATSGAAPRPGGGSASAPRRALFPRAPRGATRGAKTRGSGFGDRIRRLRACRASPRRERAARRASRTSVSALRARNASSAPPPLPRCSLRFPSASFVGESRARGRTSARAVACAAARASERARPSGSSLGGERARNAAASPAEAAVVARARRLASVLRIGLDARDARASRGRPRRAGEQTAPRAVSSAPAAASRTARHPEPNAASPSAPVPRPREAPALEATARPRA